MSVAVGEAGAAIAAPMKEAAARKRMMRDIRSLASKSLKPEK